MTETTKHTPGPWVLDVTHLHEWEGKYAVWAYDEVIAWVDPFATTNKEEYANACLISAAPDLLEVLKTIEARWDRWGQGEIQRGPRGMDHDWDTITTQLRQAISKATGVTQSRKKPTKAEQEKALMRIMTADDFGQFE